MCLCCILHSPVFFDDVRPRRHDLHRVAHAHAPLWRFRIWWKWNDDHWSNFTPCDNIAIPNDVAEEEEEITEPFWTTSTGSEMSRKKRSAKIAAFAGTIFAAVACLAQSPRHSITMLHGSYITFIEELEIWVSLWGHVATVLHNIPHSQKILFLHPHFTRPHSCVVNLVHRSIMYRTDLAANSRPSMSPHLVSCLALRPLAQSVTVSLTLLGITGRVVKVQGQVYNSMSKSG